MGKFILNIIHRPEMVPEYAEKVTGQGRKQDITRKDLLDEVARHGSRREVSDRAASHQGFEGVHGESSWLTACVHSAHFTLL